MLVYALLGGMICAVLMTVGAVMMLRFERQAVVAGGGVALTGGAGALAIGAFYDWSIASGVLGVSVLLLVLYLTLFAGGGIF